MTIPHEPRPAPPSWRPRAWPTITNLVMVAGAGLLAWSAAIHLHLWQSGYRSIPTIGPLFLFQSIAGFVLAAAVAGFRRLVPALAGAGFLASTIGGLVLSVEFGLFGFRDSFSSSDATLSIIVEATGVVVLTSACILRLTKARRPAGGTTGERRSGDARES